MPSSLSNSVPECTESAYKRKTKMHSQAIDQLNENCLCLKKKLIGTHLHMVYLFDYSVGITYTIKSITKNWNRQAVSHFHYIHHFRTIYKIQVEHKTFIKNEPHGTNLVQNFKKILEWTKKVSMIFTVLHLRPTCLDTCKDKRVKHKKEVQF